LQKEADKLSRQKNIQIKICLDKEQQRYQSLQDTLSRQLASTLRSLDNELVLHTDDLLEKQELTTNDFRFRHAKERKLLDSSLASRTK
jgi:phosphatidylserine decarboxylase